MLYHVTDLPLNKENAHVFSYPGLTYWNPIQGQFPRTLARPISMKKHQCSYSAVVQQIEGRPQSTFLTRPRASKQFIARSDCVYVIE